MASAKTPPTKQVLSFSTLLNGEPFDVDGVRYTIHHPDSLPLGVIKKVEENCPRLGGLMERLDALSTDEEQEMEQLLRETCQLVTDLPAEVQAKLHDAQLVSIVGVFTRVPSPSKAAVSGLVTPATTSRPTGGKSSRGLRGSTASRQTTGSGASRSR